MDSRKLRGGRGGTPEFVRPILNSLNEMRAERLRPDQMNSRATDLLFDELGIEGTEVECAFAHGSLDLLVEHTHYFDGFGLLCPLQEGCAVAIRASQAPTHRIVVGEPDRGLREAVEYALGLLFPDTGQHFDVGVLTNIPGIAGLDVRAAALVATVRAASALNARSTTEAEDLSLLDDPKGPDRHYFAASIMASRSTEQPAFVLVDTRKQEFLVLDVPAIERPGMAVVSAAAPIPRPHRGEHRKALRQITASLKAGPFPNIRSVRDIEHRHLDAATAVVEKGHRPLLHYLVTENARVQKLVAAIQRRDWQMFGALLIMSHASKAAGLGLDAEEADLIVSAVENMSLEGMYGATRLGAASLSVLIAGQLFSIPPALEHLRASFETRFEEPPTTLLL